MHIKQILDLVIKTTMLTILFFLVTFSLIVTKEKLWQYVGAYAFALFLFTMNLVFSARDLKNLSSFIRDEVIKRLNYMLRELLEEKHLKRKILTEIKSLKGAK